MALSMLCYMQIRQIMWSDCEDDLFEDFTDSEPVATDNVQDVVNDLESSFVRRNSNSNGTYTDTQQRDRVVVHYDHDSGETIAPSNQFEKMLLLEDIEVRFDENYKNYVYIGNITSDALAAKLESRMRVQKYKDELLHSFEEALNVQSNLITYLEPSHSSCGVQESIFRVLLLCRSSQVKAFDLLMSHLQVLQKGTDKNTLELCHLCIAQIRFIDRIYYSHALFCSIFERDIQQWLPEIRNTLISSIPEVLTDVSVQIEATQELQSFLLRDVKTDPVGCKLAVVSALLLLNSDPENAAKMQTRVLRSLSDFDLELLPYLIGLFIRRLDVSKKNAFYDLLCQLSTHLHFDQIIVAPRGKVADEIVLEVIGKIAQFVVLGGECRWKEVHKFLKTGAVSGKGGAKEVSQGNDIATGARSLGTLNTFDVILSIALLSLRTCPLNVASSIKLMLAHANENIDALYQSFRSTLKLKSFCELNVPSIISIAQQCLWSTRQNAQHFGAKLFKELFLSLPKRRELILKTMLSHAVYSEGESEAVLNEFTALVDENSETVEPFASLISDYFFILHRMTLDNARRFFRSVFRLYVKRPSLVKQKINLNTMIPLLLRSADIVQPIFGVLALFMKLETALLLEGSPTKEEDVKWSLNLLDEIINSFAHLRLFSYYELANVLNVCFGCSKCHAMNEWLSAFIEEFRSDFFTDLYKASRELESARYVCTDSNLWLKCAKSKNLGEAIPLLEAVVAALRLQEKWINADAGGTTTGDCWSRILYTLNANISMQGVEDELKSSCDVLFRTIQWIRTLFNVFSDEQVCAALDSVIVDELWTKKFLLMFECQKELNNKVSALGQWPLPDRITLSQITIVAPDSKKKLAGRIMKRKRSGNGKDVDAMEDILSTPLPTQIPHRNGGHMGKLIPISKLTSSMKTLKLPAVCRLLQLMQGRRRATIYLVEHLLDILATVCPRTGKKPFPWAKGETSGVSIHGDMSSIFSEIETLLPVLWSTFSKTVSYFRDYLNSSTVTTTESDVVEQLITLFRLCLAILKHLFSWSCISPFPSDSDVITTRKKIRRDRLMEIIEHSILHEDNERNAGSEAETTVFEFLVETCEVAPNVGAAIAILDCVRLMHSSSEELNNKLARHTLAFLKKEWVDKEGKPIRGATLTAAVKKMLSHYLNLRPVNNRLCAIQWMLAKKLADLVPHDEKRKSKVYEQDLEESDLNDQETNQIFACFTRGTFGTIYKVLFVTMNDALADVVLAISERRISVAECLRVWSIAAGCVALFGLMLRVKQLRNTSLLVSAIKEGRRFLALMCNKNSSFMYLLEEKGRLASVTEQVVEIIKSVQIGNRNFQNICVHAKANRSNVLLKLVPDFRVINEQWIRAIQTKFVGINCQDAFEIGLLKPRDINGEEIVYSGDDRCASAGPDSDPGEGAAEGHSDDDSASEIY